LFLLILLLIPVSVSAHGADVTDNIMVIANETNGIIAKELVNELNLNITVYKFTTDGDINHQLEHTLTNPNKRILAISHQDTVNNFLKSHKELKNKVIVVENVNNEEEIKNGLLELNKTINKSNDVNFKIDYVTLILVVIVIGLIAGFGVYFLKK
jgi:hypothetical protein